MSDNSNIVLEVRNISKSFGGTKALSNVDFSLNRGEVHAVIGENGAGKTTLMNIIGGIVKQDNGTLICNGEKVTISSPQEALKKGIATIHQELTMIPHLNIMENIFMGRMQKFKISRLGFINQKKLLKSTSNALNLIHLSIDPKKIVKDLSISERQEIEIIKAISSDADIIIMDEPNSSLTDVETKKLFNIIKGLTKEGVSIVYVSHRIEEILQIADRITVLRDGKFIGTVKKEDASVKSLFNMIAGRNMKSTEPRKSYKTNHKLLSIKGFTGKGFQNISFDLYEGEILGFYGLVGSGRSELARAIYGADRIEAGKTYIDEREFYFKSPVEAIKKGVAMVPEDRKDQGLFLNLSVSSNMTISHLPNLSHLKFNIKSSKENKLIAEFIRKLNIKLRNPDQSINDLSGGNQQKVILARNLMIDPKIIILDEPTQGIDVGAKEEIYKLIDNLAKQGMGIILISSEISEIIAVSDRIAVLHEGRLSGILKKEEFSEQKLIAYATGYGNQVVT